MGNRHGIMIMVLGACLLAAAGCNGGLRRDVAQEQPQTLREVEVPQVEATIELTGSGLSQPKTFTFEQLAAMEMTRLDDVMMLQSHAPDEMTGWRGPSLDLLLTAAGIKPGPMVLTFEATDGYGFDTLRQELGPAIVALQDGEGRWLAHIDKTCPLRLVAPEQLANYWVMNVQKITVVPEGGTGASP